MRKKLAMTLIVSILLSMFLSGCDKESTQSKGVIKPNGETLVLTILCSAEDINFLKKNPVLVEYKKSFEKNFGVKVTYSPVGTIINSDESLNNYYKELATKLYTKGGAELIYSSDIIIESLIKQKAVLDLRDKVKNNSNIYDSLVAKEVFYVPIGMSASVMALNKDVVLKLGLNEPDFDWLLDDYYEIRDKWVNQKVRVFTSRDYSDIYGKYLSDVRVFDMENNKAHINTEEIVSGIKKMREEIFSRKYELENYTYEDYYNMLYVPTSEEWMDNYKIWSSTEYKNSHFLNQSIENDIDPFKAKDIDGRRNIKNLIVLPDVRNTKKYLSTWGFMVNANGKNLDLAYEFINGMLENEFQLKIFEDEDLMYPVSKNIEADILNLEANQGLDEKSIGMKKYFLDQVKNGNYEFAITRSYKENQLREMFIKDYSQFIFGDKSYSDTELSIELQKLEDKYNIFLSE
jgi:ABC-type glycerol-3-phosphate transport system substrate-binding protein